MIYKYKDSLGFETTLVPPSNLPNCFLGCFKDIIDNVDTQNLF